ncbi:MAG: Flagellar hook-length control protein FliK [Myxococcaceae bacterium]|nr:Flagellar hook-length control protein FliK [Myxococcaceae bacterium]
MGCGDDSSPPGHVTDEGPSTVGVSGDAGKPRPDAGKAERDAQVVSMPPAHKPPVVADDETPVLETLQIDDCGDGSAAGLSAAQLKSLKAGGQSDGMHFLYPYDKTVFPRGIGAPQLMWDGAGNDAVYVHIKSDYFEYQGCMKPDSQGVLKLPDSAWAGAEKQTLGPKSPFTIELSVLDGQTVRGPITETLIIAQATLKGSLYYNTYNSGLGGGSFSLGGTVERIKPGQPAEFFSRTGECTGCHSVSANGKRMITKEVLGAQPGYVFALDTDTQPNPQPLRTATNTSFVGLSPDGSVYLTTAYQGVIGPPTEGAITTPTPLESILYDTDTGAAVPNSGFPKSAMMPTFSFDATLAAFNDYARGNGHTLSLIDYDATSRTAKNQRELFTSMDGYLGWPFLLPDNGGMVFTQTESGAFSGGGSFITAAVQRGPKSDLMMVDLETGQATILARAMGFDTAQDAAAGNSYLPFGADEQHQAYYPTVSPVAAGGYFWLFFDSIRHYGNQGLRRQLWATAITVQRRSLQEGVDNNGALYGVDLSSPAFYMPGQDFNTANHRAFTALDPCLTDGAACESGIDCCSGFCTKGVCGPPEPCGKRNDKCVEDTDCCDKNDLCINGFCGQVPL